MVLVCLCREATFVELWRNGGFLFRKELDTREKSPEFRLLIVQLCQDYNAQKMKLSKIFSISRQSIDDWIASFNKHGIVGLINSSKNIGNSHRSKENKGKTNTADRQHKQHTISKIQYSLEDIKLPSPLSIEPENIPYESLVEKHNNRYAGVFALEILLVSEFSWFNWTIGLFGDAYKILLVKNTKTLIKKQSFL